MSSGVWREHHASSKPGAHDIKISSVSFKHKARKSKMGAHSFLQPLPNPMLKLTSSTDR